MRPYVAGQDLDWDGGFVMHDIVEPLKPDRASRHPVSRRALLEGSARAGLVAAAAGWSSAALGPGDVNAADGSPRQTAAFHIRQAAAQTYLDEPQPVHRSNGDEARYADKRASFAKTLPHNDAGEVDAEAFATFVSVLSSGDPNGFETIPRDRNAEVDLNDPQAAYAFDLAGLDSAATSLDPPPTFASALMATEMAELYWLALTRDVPFRRYETDPLVAAAVADMNAFTELLTSGTGGEADTSNAVSRRDAGRPHRPLSQPVPVARHPLRHQDDRAALHRAQPRAELPHGLRRMACLPARRQAAIQYRVRCDCALHLQRARAC
jgi:hypothetical protein